MFIPSGPAADFDRFAFVFTLEITSSLRILRPLKFTGTALVVADPARASESLAPIVCLHQSGNRPVLVVVQGKDSHLRSIVSRSMSEWWTGGKTVRHP